MASLEGSLGAGALVDVLPLRGRAVSLELKVGLEGVVDRLLPGLALGCRGVVCVCGGCVGKAALTRVEGTDVGVVGTGVGFVLLALSPEKSLPWLRARSNTLLFLLGEGSLGPGVAAWAEVGGGGPPHEVSNGFVTLGDFGGSSFRPFGGGALAEARDSPLASCLSMLVATHLALTWVLGQSLVLDLGLNQPGKG